jgi:hypothetical protein
VRQFHVWFKAPCLVAAALAQVPFLVRPNPPSSLRVVEDRKIGGRYRGYWAAPADSNWYDCRKIGPTSCGWSLMISIFPIRIAINWRSICQFPIFRQTHIFLNQWPYLICIQLGGSFSEALPMPLDRSEGSSSGSGVIESDAVFESIPGFYRTNGLPSGNGWHSYWNWPFIVDLPIKNGDFP